MNGTRICLRKFIIRCAKNPDGKEFLDLEFDIRPGSYSSKWIDCIRSVEHLPPHQYGFPRWREPDAGVYEQRIADALKNNTDIQKFLVDSNIDWTVIDQTLVNTVHRYIESQNYLHTDKLLVLHNDIHYLESIWEDTKQMLLNSLEAKQMLENKLSVVPDTLKLELKSVIKQTIENYIDRYQAQSQFRTQLSADLNLLVENLSKHESDLLELPNAGILKKLQWVPPGLTIDMTLDDYREFTTEPCTNFIQDDFSHVGRSPHNSYLYQDDSSLYTSCVIQHKVGSGIKWFIPDDSHIFGDVQGFREWVSEHQEFFQNQWGIETNDDPRLCHGRIIIATGCADYSRIDRQFDFIVQAFIQ